MLTLIAAVSEDGFIGKEKNLPWRLKSDMAHFKDTTEGHTVVMGRKTWDSISERLRPLPRRRNIVLTRQATFEAERVETVNCLESALNLVENQEQVFVMGGGEIYRLFLPFAERLLLTHVHTTLGRGDTIFPALKEDAWNIVSRTDIIQSEGDDFSFHIVDYTPNLPFIEFANIRTLKQLRVMRTIREAGHCPFCSEHFHLYHKPPITWTGDHWIVTDNQWSYLGKNVHKLVILKNHAEDVSELPWGAGNELMAIVHMVEEETGVTGCALGLRSGDPILTGASVKHLHAHIISPKKGAEPVKFFIGGSRRIEVPFFGK
jgi:dihydrofolate reductase